MTATNSIPGSLSAARNKFRPMRPKPLIPTFTAINNPPLFIITGLIQSKNLTRVARRCQSQQLACRQLVIFLACAKKLRLEDSHDLCRTQDSKKAVGCNQKAVGSTSWVLAIRLLSPPTTCHLPPTSYLLSFQQHSRFMPAFSTALLCFQQHSRVGLAKKNSFVQACRRSRPSCPVQPLSMCALVLFALNSES